MRTVLTVLLTAAALAACTGPQDTPDVETSIDAPIQAFADATGADQEALDEIGAGLCEQIARSGDAGLAAWVNAFQDDRVGLGEDDATRTATAFAVRYCPELAG